MPLYRGNTITNLVVHKRVCKLWRDYLKCLLFIISITEAINLFLFKRFFSISSQCQIHLFFSYFFASSRLLLLYLHGILSFWKYDWTKPISTFLYSSALLIGCSFTIWGFVYLFLFNIKIILYQNIRKWTHLILSLSIQAT